MRTVSRRAGNIRLLMTMNQKKIDPATSVRQLDTLAPESERVIEDVKSALHRKETTDELRHVVGPHHRGKVA